VLESIGRDNIKLSDKAIEELISLLDKEQVLQAEQKIEKAIAKSMKEAEKLKSEVDKADKDLSKLVNDIHDSAKEIQDIANEITKAVQSIDREATNIDKKQLEEFTELLSKLASRRRHEEIVHIDDLMNNIKVLKETSDEARLKHIEAVLEKFDADKDGVVTVNDIRKVIKSCSLG